MRIPIYRNGARILFVNPDGSSELVQEYMNKDYVSLNFVLDGFVQLEIGDYILLEDFIPYKKGRYTLKVIPDIPINRPREYHYECIFSSNMYFMGDIQFRPLNSQNFEFELTGRPEDFVQDVCSSLNRELGADKWRVGNIEPLIHGYYKTMNFDNVMCNEALRMISEEYNVDFYFQYVQTSEEDYSLIHLEAPSDKLPDGVRFETGAYGGLRNLSQTKADPDLSLKTEIWGYGSKDNLSHSYNSPVVPKRLAFEGDNGESKLSENKHLYGVRQLTIVKDDIKPNRVGEITDVLGVDKIADASLSFNIQDYYIENITPMINILSGKLTGRQFEYMFDFQTKTFTLKPLTDPVTGFVFPSVEYGEFEVGDKYNLINISLPQSYIDEASELLKNAVQIELDKRKNPEMNYALEIDEYEVRRKKLNLFAGLLIDLRNVELGIYREIRVRHLRQNIVNPYLYDLTVSDHGVIGGQISTKYTVIFVVMDSDSNPIKDASVRINFVTLHTNELGMCMVDVSSGVYDYLVRLDDFQDVSGEAVVSGGELEILVVMDSYAYAVDYYGEHATDLLTKFGYGTEY